MLRASRSREFHASVRGRLPTLSWCCVLLGIAFLAGIVTAISPCVLPVLPILLAGSAGSTDRRRPFAIVAGLVVSFTTFTLVRRGAPERPRPAGGPPSQHRDRSAARARREPALAAGRVGSRAAVPLPHQAAGRAGLERLRRRPQRRARLRPLRRPGARGGHRPRGERRGDVPDRPRDRRVRTGRRSADAGDRHRWSTSRLEHEGRPHACCRRRERSPASSWQSRRSRSRSASTRGSRPPFPATRRPCRNGSSRPRARGRSSIG